MRIVIDLSLPKNTDESSLSDYQAVSFVRSIVDKIKDDQDKGLKSKDLWISVNSNLKEKILEIRKFFDDSIPDFQIRIFSLPENSSKKISEETQIKIDQLIYEKFLDQLKPDALILTDGCNRYVGQDIISKYHCSILVTDTNDERKLSQICKDANILLPMSDLSKKLIENSGILNKTRNIDLTPGSENKSAITKLFDLFDQENLDSLRQKIPGHKADNNNDAAIQKIAALLPNEALNNRYLAQIASSLEFNSRSNCKQLLIDISELVQADAKSGIQRVVRSLLIEIFKTPPENMIPRAIYYDGAHYKYATNYMERFLGNKESDPIHEIVNFKQDDIYLSLDLNLTLNEYNQNIHKYLKEVGVQLYFVIYDLLPLQNSDWWPLEISVIFKKWLEKVSTTATGFICISNAVAQDAKNWVDQNPPDRISSIDINSFHLGADIENSKPSMGLPKNANSILHKIKSKQSFLMVSTIEPRKGHAQVLAAFERLWSNGIDANLVIVGKKGWCVDEFIEVLRYHPEAKGRLIWLEGISDEFLRQVYSASTCLLAASEGEGFGLPLIESAQIKLPIIARDLEVFKEVAGDHAFYFDNRKEPEAIAKAITDWIGLFQVGKHPKSNEMPWLTWKQSSQQLLSILI